MFAPLFLCFLPAVLGYLPASSRLAVPLAGRSAAPRLALSDRGEGGLLKELPPERLIRAVERAGERVSAADIAAASGLDLLETRRALLVLARLTAADLQVASNGELVFVFGRDVRGQLRSASLRARVGEAWEVASVPVLWLLRATFGIALLSSIAIAVTGIAALSASKSSSDEDNRGGSSLTYLPMRMFGPSPLDFFYYGTRSNGTPEGDRGFLQSCFSFLFGDGDPNADFRSRSLRAAAALIRAQVSSY